MSGQITRFLAERSDGDPRAVERLIPVVFLRKRPGHARCVACHSAPRAVPSPARGGGELDLERGGVAPQLRLGERPSWSQGRPEESRLLLMPLAAEAGGVAFPPGRQALGVQGASGPPVAGRLDTRRPLSRGEPPNESSPGQILARRRAGRLGIEDVHPETDRPLEARIVSIRQNHDAVRLHRRRPERRRSHERWRGDQTGGRDGWSRLASADVAARSFTAIELAHDHRAQILPSLAARAGSGLDTPFRLATNRARSNPSSAR